MVTSEQQTLIERAIVGLRQKRDKVDRPVISIDEIISTFTQEDQLNYQHYHHRGFLNDFYEATKNNPKIHFDPHRRQFSFKHIYTDLTDLVNKLYQEKRGVRENVDLYDDLDKDQIQRIKKSDLLRELEIKEKKTKNPIVVLFAKNYQNDEIDNLQFEKKTSDYLKNYWHGIEKEAQELEKTQKYSALGRLNRLGKHNRKVQMPKRERRRQELNVYSWHNRHIANKVQVALDKMKEFVEITNKNKLKRIKLK